MNPWEIAVAALAALSLGAGALNLYVIGKVPHPDPPMDDRIEGAVALLLLGVLLVVCGAFLWG